jgi:hypothetical protein
VNKNVTTPKGGTPADTHAESHNRHAPTSYIGGSGPVTGYMCFETNYCEPPTVGHVGELWDKVKVDSVSQR